MRAQRFDLGGEVKADAQLADDVGKAALDLLQGFGEILLCRRLVIAAIQKIGDLDVVRGALSGRGGDHVAPAGIGLHDGGGLLEDAEGSKFVVFVKLATFDEAVRGELIIDFAWGSKSGDKDSDDAQNNEDEESPPA